MEWLNQGAHLFFCRSHSVAASHHYLFAILAFKYLIQFRILAQCFQVCGALRRSLTKDYLLWATKSVLQLDVHSLVLCLLLLAGPFTENLETDRFEWFVVWPVCASCPIAGPLAT